MTAPKKTKSAVDTCRFCGHDSVMTSDTDDARRYECPQCGAFYNIAKGSTPGWWYFGWELNGKRFAP